MATKVLSIEIGQRLTRIVEMDYKTKNPKIYNCFTFVTPEGVVNDDVVACTDTFISLLKAECERWDIHTKKVVFSVTSRRILNHQVQIPLVKEKQILDMLNANVQDYFQVDMLHYHLAYKIISKINTPEEKVLNLKVLAVPDEVTDSYVAFADACGLTLLALDYDGNSVFYAMEGIFADEIHAVVKAEEGTTSITIVKNGETDFHRTLTYGMGGTIDAVREMPVFGNELTYDEAIRVLCQQAWINNQFGEIPVSEEDIDVSEARIKVTQSLQGFIESVSQILRLYMESKDIVKIDHIHLIGLGGDFSGLDQLMCNELQQKVSVFRGMEGSAVEKTIRDNCFSISSYITCVGATMNPLDLLENKPVKSLPEMGLKDLLHPVVMGGAVLALGILVSVGLTAYSLIDYFSTQHKIETVQGHINDIEATGVQNIYYEYITLEALSEELEDIYISTLSRSEDLVEFIEELEEKMPSSVTVVNFSANAQGISMSLTVNTKEEAAMALLQLKTFDSIDVVSTSGLTESVSETGETAVSFSVSLTYKAIDTEEAMAEHAEEETAEDESIEDEEDEEAADDEAADTTTSDEAAPEKENDELEPTGDIAAPTDDDTAGTEAE